MRGCKVRKLVVLIGLGALVALLVRKLRGDPAPQFSNHPTVKGGPLPDLVPAPADPTVPADAATALVPAPEDPTVAADASTRLVAAPDDTTTPTTGSTGTDGPAWVEAVDGACPDGYPVKAKLKSGIFHQPGGLAYDRTNPDRCYRDAAYAEADGLRAAKR